MDLEQRHANILSNFRQIEERVGEMTNEELVHYHLQLDAVHEVSKELEERIKTEFKIRRDEAGKDARGNSTFADGNDAVRVEPRTRITLKEDAYWLLEDAGYLPLFPIEPDLTLMEDFLESLKINKTFYSLPEVTKDTVAALADEGKIPKEFARKLFDVNTSYAIRKVVQKELTDG